MSYVYVRFRVRGLKVTPTTLFGLCHARNGLKRPSRRTLAVLSCSGAGHGPWCCVSLECHVVPYAHHYEGAGCTRRARWSMPSAVRQGGACPRPSGEAKTALGRRARWSLAIRGRARQSLALKGQARWNQSSIVRTRNIVAFPSDWKCQRSMVISSTSLGTSVLGPRQYACMS